jgi:phosphohistidine phosphatase
MKTLLLLRHAKSSWRDDSLSDFDRPLNERGKRDAPAVGHVLRERHLRPEVVLCSSAKRARKTAIGAIEASGFEVDLQLFEELYLAPPDVYLGEIAKLPDEVTCVMCVGHNPGLEELFAQLTARHEPLPTAALVHIELPIDHWREMKSRPTGKLISLWRPTEEEG